MKSKIPYIASVLLVIAIILVVSWYRQEQKASFVQSNFDEGPEGWIVSGDVQSDVPSYSANGGHPGGFIYAQDKAVGGVWYWHAPKKFYGDRSSYYGEYLSFELKQSSTNNQFDDDDVIIEADDETRLILNVDHSPGLDWTKYKLRLDESKQWMNNKTGKRATKTEIQNVLRALSGIYIRGEFVVGDDMGSLDNVRLGQHS